MAASQFTIYRSTDPSAPVLNGTAGSLLTVLDACLVNGYGSKSGAGWTKPFVNSGNIGCYQNSSLGTNFCLSINDNGPGAASFAEARMTGYESLTSVSTGGGQFPNGVAGQGVTPFGFVVYRKSNGATSTARNWIVMADAYTFYIFCLTTDVANAYTAFAFGDFFSLKGVSDVYRCGIHGRISENTAAGNQDSLATLGALTATNIGNYVARTYGGGGFPVQVSKHGDGVKAGAQLFGSTQYPNGPDNSIYVSPVWLAETALSCIRGRMRGFYQICHAFASFADGQTFSGTGDFASKTFMCIKQGTDSNGNSIIYLMEISATVETNS
jgi:hypothetical protein